MLPPFLWKKGVTKSYKDSKFRRKKLKKINRKKTIHFYLDWIWKNGIMTRNEVYIEFAKRLQVEEPKSHLHVINRDEELERALKVARNLQKKLLKQIERQSRAEVN